MMIVMLLKMMIVMMVIVTCSSSSPPGGVMVCDAGEGWRTAGACPAHPHLSHPPPAATLSSIKPPTWSVLTFTHVH